MVVRDLTSFVSQYITHPNMTVSEKKSHRFLANYTGITGQTPFCLSYNLKDQGTQETKTLMSCLEAIVLSCRHAFTFYCTPCEASMDAYSSECPGL